MGKVPTNQGTLTKKQRTTPCLCKGTKESKKQLLMENHENKKKKSSEDQTFGVQKGKKKVPTKINGATSRECGSEVGQCEKPGGRKGNPSPPHPKKKKRRRYRGRGQIFVKPPGTSEKKKKRGANSASNFWKQWCWTKTRIPTL